MDAAQSPGALTPSASAGRFRVPAGRHDVEQVIERSRFRCALSRARTPDEAHAFVRTVQAESPEATHHCWAFVAGPPGSTAHIGLSDDGEPHGTAGRPMFTVLAHAPVGEIVAVVTRWYGGVKLGTGGLARAYGGAVQEALSGLPTTWRVDRERLVIGVEYAAVTPVRQLLERLDVELHAERYGEHVEYDLAIARDQAEELHRCLADLTRGRATTRPG